MCDLQSNTTTEMDSRDKIQDADNSSLSNPASVPLESGKDCNRRVDSPDLSFNTATPFSHSELSTQKMQTSNVRKSGEDSSARSEVCLEQDHRDEYADCLIDDGGLAEAKDDDATSGDSRTLPIPGTVTHHEEKSMADSSGTEKHASAAVPSGQRSTSPMRMPCSLCDDVNLTAMAHCSECDADLCSACVRRHSRMNLAVHHNVMLFQPQHTDDSTISGSGITNAKSCRSMHSSSLLTVDRCQKHPEERLRFFCKTCQSPVCRDCILTSHKQHVTQDIADAKLAAKNEMVDMLAQLAQMKTVLETYQKSFEEYKIQFGHKVELVGEMITTFYNETRERIDASYHKLSEELGECQKTELERIRCQELIVQNNIRDATKLLDQQVLNLDSSIRVLSQHEMVSYALKTLSKNINQIELTQSQFFISKNPKLASIPDHFLGRVSLTTHTFPQSEQNLRGKTVIKEVTLHRDLAFNICESKTSRSSVQSLVETSSGTVWVATSQSLLKVTNEVKRENSSRPDNIASLVAGPGDKLLVSLGQGSSVKVYSNGSWTPFASVPKGSMVMASQVEQQHRLRVYVAVTPQTGTTRIVSYSTEGQVCQQFKLPADILHGTMSTPANGHHSKDVCSAKGASATRSLKPTCMAVGRGGRLYLGDAGGRRLLVLDSGGALTGQYLGPDGHSGCQPCSVCMVESEQVVVADSERSTVELVSGDGKFLALLLSRENFLGIGHPTCLTVDSKNRLWVGTSWGHVYAFTFLRTCPASRHASDSG